MGPGGPLALAMKCAQRFTDGTRGLAARRKAAYKNVDPRERPLGLGWTRDGDTHLTFIAPSMVITCDDPELPDDLLPTLIARPTPAADELTKEVRDYAT